MAHHFLVAFDMLNHVLSSSMMDRIHFSTILEHWMKLIPKIECTSCSCLIDVVGHFSKIARREDEGDTQEDEKILK